MAHKNITAVCRICPGACSLIYEVDSDNKVVSVRGDKTNPVTKGYACVKGLQWHEFHQSNERLLYPLKRQADGSFCKITLDRALEEIAENVKGIIENHGAESIAAFRGTAGYFNLPTFHMQPGWLSSIGSNSFYSTMTIDQSAKWVTPERLGTWAAGKDAVEVADVILILGSNPLVALTTSNFYMQNPMKNLKEAKKRGLKLIVIDPRHTETARHADVFLQPHPGEDVTVLSGILHIIFKHGWYDADFCQRNVKDLEKLIEAVEPFTPDYVSHRAGVTVESLRAAASAFAEPLTDTSGIRPKRGAATSGTGPSMGPHSSLAEHLLECLNVVCGRFARPGDKVMNPGVVGARYPRVATVIPPGRSWESGWKSRIGGYGILFGEKPASILAQEITTPGPGQIRGMFVSGGNPVNAMPDYARTRDAFSKLDLLVSIEPYMTHTSKLAHYILPPKMMLEVPSIPNRDLEPILMSSHPYGQYGEPAFAPPAESELVEDWYVYWDIARRLQKTVIFDGVPLDMEKPPTSDQLFAIITRNSGVALEELKRYPKGTVFEVEPMYVQSPGDDHTGRFDVAPDDVDAEIRQVLKESGHTGGYSHILSVRRLREVTNTSFHQVPKIRKVMPYNPAYLHSDDMHKLGVASGNKITIASEHGQVEAIAKADDSLRQGMVNLPHGWGPLPGEEANLTVSGTNVNILTTSEEQRDPITAMAVMTGIPVTVSPG